MFAKSAQSIYAFNTATKKPLNYGWLLEVQQFTLSCVVALYKYRGYIIVAINCFKLTFFFLQVKDLEGSLITPSAKSIWKQFLTVCKGIAG